MDKMYLTVFVQETGEGETQTQVLCSTFDYVQAFKVAQDLLHNNPNVKTEQVFVKEFIFKKDLKILDYQE
jgi:hypothetical protein